jgi:hypothetical protein
MLVMRCRESLSESEREQAEPSELSEGEGKVKLVFKLKSYLRLTACQFGFSRGLKVELTNMLGYLMT